MRVLVTGATGFVGSHLVEKLDAKNIQLNVLVRQKWSNSLPMWLHNSNIIYGDLTDISCVNEAVNGVDVVIHSASLLGRWQSEFPEHYYSKVNVDGTKNLINASMAEGVTHFIYLSTAGVMGRLVNMPADETHPFLPVYPYEKSKCFAELALRKAIVTKNFPATIVRATHIYGPRDKNTLKIFKVIKKTQIFPLIGGGNNLFQPLYIEDLIKALILCLENPKMSIGETYLVAGKDVLTYRDFILLSAKALGISVMNIPLSVTIANLLASATETVCHGLNIEPPLTHSRVEFFSRDQIYTIKKIYKSIGFFPETSIATGLNRMIDWCKTNSLL